MSFPVTAPGVSGSTITLQFATQQNASLAVQLLSQIYTANALGTLNVQNAGGSTIPGSLVTNEFTVGDQGGLQNTGTNVATVPGGFAGVIDAFNNGTAATITGSGDLNETVLASGGLTFNTGIGSGTVLSGAGNNLVYGGGNWDVVFDGGNNTVSAPTGNWFIQDGNALTTGSNHIFLGNGSDTVVSFGNDTIASSGSSDTIIAAGPSAFVFSNGGLVINATTGPSTVVGGTGPETVFATSANGLYFGGGGPLLFVTSAAHSTVVAGASNTTLFGGSGGGLYFEGSSGLFLLDGESGAQTVAGSSSITPPNATPLLFSENGGSITLFGNTNNLLIAGGGNVTLNGGGASGNNVFFAGNGADSLVGGSGGNVLVAGTGADTLSGGTSFNAFEFVHGLAGGSDLVRNWTNGNPNDQLYLLNYSAGGGGISSQTVVGGNLVVKLSDNTTITFQGVTSNLTASQVHTT